MAVRGSKAKPRLSSLVWLPGRDGRARRGGGEGGLEVRRTQRLAAGSSALLRLQPPSISTLPALAPRNQPPSRPTAPTHRLTPMVITGTPSAPATVLGPSSMTSSSVLRGGRGSGVGWGAGSRGSSSSSSSRHRSMTTTTSSSPRQQRSRPACPAQHSRALTARWWPP